MAEVLCDSKSVTITVAEGEADSFWTIWRIPPTIPYDDGDWIGVRYKNLSTKKHNVCLMLKDAAGHVYDASPEGCRGGALDPAWDVAAGEVKEFKLMAKGDGLDPIEKGLAEGAHILRVVVCREEAWI